LQSYITPDAFMLDLSVLFFIAILIGGRSSILGPLLGTILLTVLPEFAAPLVAWSTFLYAVLLLLIVLAIPGGIAEILDFKNRRPLESDRAIVPRPDLVARMLDAVSDAGSLTLEQVALSFGGVRAIDGLDLEIRRGQVHGLIGPNGSGKTTTLNVISGYYAPQRGAVRLNGAALAPLARAARAHRRIARTFQTPRIVGCAAVLEKCDDRRDDRRTWHVRRIAAVAATASARRGDAAQHRHAGARLRRARATGAGSGRPAATRRAPLH
jgi:branched-chain amino acid transport system permease protein